MKRLLLILCLVPLLAFSQITKDEWNYNSTIDPTVCTNLLMDCFYLTSPSATNLPLVVAMHSLGSTGGQVFGICSTFATNGYFAIAPTMRGAAAGGGVADSSGREIYDIYDAINLVLANYSNKVSHTQICIMGDSGGGGNTLAFACKFPDTSYMYSDYYGMSDYSCCAGDFYPGASADSYLARRSDLAITNLTSGFLYMWHNSTDGVVSVSQSLNVSNQLQLAGRTNYLLTMSTNLYSHGNFNYNIDSENVWLSAITNGTYSTWTVPASGCVMVLGYIVTKRFTCWLSGGTNQVAVMCYGNGLFTLNPVTTNGLNVSLTYNGNTIVTNISVTTTLSFASIGNAINISGATLNSFKTQ